jgi:Fe-S-cluster-containing dehydrogenase component
MLFDMPSCGGCRTCELACSFKHTGEFAPAVSSLVILDKEDGVGFTVSLAEKNEERRLSCDGCRGLNIPLCVQYCLKSEDLKAILKAFLEKAPSPRKENGTL